MTSVAAHTNREAEAQILAGVSFISKRLLDRNFGVVVRYVPSIWVRSKRFVIQMSIQSQDAQKEENDQSVLFG